MTSRRDFLKIGASGLAFALASRFRFARAAAPKKQPPRSVIVLWMNGGPSHLDTWDPKPGTKTGGPFKAIPTATPGVSICEHLPRLAAQSGKLAIVRGLTTKEGNHQRASYLLHTGYVPNATVVHPSLGAWVSEELADPKFDLPSFVAISGPSAGAGFLGVQHGPFVVGNPGQPPLDTGYPRNVDFVRFQRRKAALDFLEDRFDAEAPDPKAKSRRAVYDKAVRMMYAPRLQAFDLSSESDKTRAAYGDTPFGRGCLLARRLVEAGVRCVEVTLDGWDTHKDNFGRTEKLMAQLDPAMAQLLTDLEERELLSRTLVVWMGDFGRTPTVNPNEGRDHWPEAQSVVLAGCGIRGGIAHGRTDDQGANVVDKPVQVPDLFATIATALGMDPGKELDTPVGRPVSITFNGTPIRDLMIGS